MTEQPQKTREYHLVSKVILRQFCDDRHLLTAFNVRHATTKTTGPGGVCWVSTIRPNDPVAFEGYWKRVEDHLPKALEAIKARVVLDERLSSLLRECLAIHLARSKTLMKLHGLALPYYENEIDRSVLRNPANERALARRFYQKHGLWPAGRDGLEMARAEERKKVRPMLDAMMPASFMKNYQSAQRLVGTQPVEICVAQEGEFLIGDAPAQSLKSGHSGVGPFGGVPWTEATTFVLPLSRRYAVSLGEEAHYLDLDEGSVDLLNRIQVVSAQDHIMWHPSADFRQFISGVQEGPATDSP